MFARQKVVTINGRIGSYHYASSALFRLLHLLQETLKMDQIAEENVRSRFNIDPSQQLADFHFRETRSDIQSSVILLSHRVKRQYMSEFVLPDDTRIAVRRIESSMPADQTEVVIVSLAVRHPFDSVLPQFVTTPPGETDVWKSDCDSTTTLETSGEVTTDSDDEVTLEKVDPLLTS